MPTCRTAVFLALGTLLCLAPRIVHAQKPKDKDAPTPGDEMIYKYLCAETDKLSAKFLDGAKTLDEWQKKRPRLYQEYMDMLGLWPIPERTPLKATVTGTFEHEGVIIDKLHFQSKPGLYVTANLYRPKAGKRTLNDKQDKLPTILYVCGHSNKGRDGSKTAYQGHPMWFASNGYNCLILDTHQLGEIPGVHHGTYGRPWNHLKAYGLKDKDALENRFWWHSAGYTPAGVEAWNGVRAIDYLLTRDDVDPERIGVTGISGGGAATFWIACADDRVKVAVPVSGMSDLESYVKNKVVNGHCDCMFLYNTGQWDWTTIAALVAPRPLLFANSDNDSIFPMDGNRRVIDKLRTLYKLYGKSELVDDYVSVGGHAYRPDLRVAIFKFINKHLKGDTTTPVKDTEFKPIDGKLLRVFPTDDDLPKDAINARVDETFVPRGKVEVPQQEKFKGWKRDLIARLRTGPLSSQTPPNAAAFVEFASGLKITVNLKANDGVVFQVAPFVGEDPKSFLSVVVLGPEDPRRIEMPQMIKPVLGKESGLLLWPRGREGEWTQKSPPNYVARSHALLGSTTDRGRLNDIVGTLRLLQQERKKTAEIFGTEDAKPIRIGGKGQAGILAAYAALFEPSIKEVVLIDPPTSHKEGPHFLGVLRVCDIPEALGLLAPNVKLTLINAKDPAFDRTVEIYRRAGAADKIVRK